MKYLTRRFSEDRSRGSTGERIGAATKVVGLGTAATLGAGYGISKGASAYLGNKSRNLNYDLLDSFMNKGVPGANNKLLETGAKKAALEGSQGIANHLAKKAGKGALIAGGIGLGGMLAQKYYRKKKNQRNFAVTVGRFARKLTANTVKSPGAAGGALLGASGLGASSVFVSPVMASFPWITSGTTVGHGLNRLLPRRWRLGLEKTSRRIKANPEAYKEAGLPVPRASRVGSRIERTLDGSWLGKWLNPRFEKTQDQGHKVIKKLKSTKKRLADTISSGLISSSERLAELPTVGSILV